MCGNLSFSGGGSGGRRLEPALIAICPLLRGLYPHHPIFPTEEMTLTSPSYITPCRKLSIRLRLRIRARRRRPMSITVTPTLPNYESFLTTGRYISSVSGLADYLVSHCKIDGYINLSRAHALGTTDTITFVYEQGQCWATGHFTGNGERDADWRTRTLFKRRERTAVEVIVS